LHSDKDHQILFVDSPKVHKKSKMADGGYIKKSIKRYISVTVIPMGTKFGRMTHSDPLNPIGR